MSTPAQIAAQASRRRRRLYLTLAAVLLVLVVVGAWFLGRSTVVNPEPESAESASPSPPAVDAGGFELLSGQEQALGRYPVGFPQTAQGAVSATVHGLQAQSTNDARALSEALSTYHLYDYDVTTVEETLLRERSLELFLSKPDGSDFDRDDFPDRKSVV